MRRFRALLNFKVAALLGVAVWRVAGLARLGYSGSADPGRVSTGVGDRHLLALGKIGPGGLRSRTPRRSISPSVVCSALAALDAVVIMIAGAVALFAYADPGYVEQSGGIYLGLSIAGAASMVLLGWANHLYSHDVLSRPFLRPWHAIGSWLAAVFGLLGAVFFFHTAETLSRGWVGGWFIIGAAGLGLARIVLRAKIAWWRRHGWMRQRIVVVGAPEATALLISRLKQPPLCDLFQVQGSFLDGSTENADTALVDGSASRPAHSLVPFLRQNTVEIVMICVGWRPASAANALCQQLTELPVEVVLCPDCTAFDLPVTRAHLLGDLSLLQISRPPLGDGARIVKGLEDRIIAMLMLLFLWPLMLAAAIAIKLESPGPILFRQQRFGFNNRAINVLKFRTMHTALQDVTGSQRTVRGDRRVTRVGRFLRATSADELPQLLNVLRGEMSLVGPRAHPILMRVTDQLYNEAVQGYAARHRVKPGITGLAQINGCRGEVDTIEKAQARIRHDLDYVSRWSLWLDLKIILLTPIRAFRGY